MPKSTVAHYLQQLCNTTFEGGRIVQDDDHTIMMYDVPMWPGTRSDALRQKFQNIEIDIYQCTSSISGFLVIVTVVPTSTTHSSRLAMILLLTFTVSICLLCWQCLQLASVNIHDIKLFTIAALGQRATCGAHDHPNVNGSNANGSKI
jgi:hypothetical protein